MLLQLCVISVLDLILDIGCQQLDMNSDAAVYFQGQTDFRFV